jgi:hypothetical protein
MRNWTAAWAVGAMVAAGGTAVSAQDVAEARNRAVRPAPIQAALTMLRWPTHQVPQIEVIEVRPLHVNVLAEGWVVCKEDGNAWPKIYIAGWSSLYRGALANPGRSQDAIRLAGVLAHERSHLEQGADEERAYVTQLSTLERLQATHMDRTSVSVALQTVKRQRQARR